MFLTYLSVYLSDELHGNPVIGITSFAIKMPINELPIISLTTHKNGKMIN